MMKNTRAMDEQARIANEAEEDEDAIEARIQADLASDDLARNANLADDEDK